MIHGKKMPFRSPSSEHKGSKLVKMYFTRCQPWANELWSAFISSSVQLPVQPFPCRVEQMNLELSQLLPGSGNRQSQLVCACRKSCHCPRCVPVLVHPQNHNPASAGKSLWVTGQRKKVLIHRGSLSDLKNQWIIIIKNKLGRVLSGTCGMNSAAAVSARHGIKGRCGVHHSSLGLFIKLGLFINLASYQNLWASKTSPAFPSKERWGKKAFHCWGCLWDTMEGSIWLMCVWVSCCKNLHGLIHLTPSRMAWTTLLIPNTVD